MSGYPDSLSGLWEVFVMAILSARPSKMSMLLSVPSEVLIHIMQCFSSREVRMIAITSRYFDEFIKSHEEIWQGLFRYQWNRINFQIKPNEPLVLSKHLQQQYPCTSDGYRFLCQIVQLVPSSLNTDYARGYEIDNPGDYKIDMLPHAHNLPHFQLNTEQLPETSHGRSVRANAPFRFVPTATIHRQKTARGLVWEVELSSSAYFEMTVGNPTDDPPTAFDEFENDSWSIISIGLAPSRYIVLENHPGWEAFSYGYRGDEGIFMTEPEVEDLETFGPGDTVGCGLHFHSRHAWIYFTKNGRRLPRDFGCCRGVPLYPMIGVSYTVPISINFGQQPFQYNAYHEVVNDVEFTAAHTIINDENFLDWESYLYPDEDDDDDSEGPMDFYFGGEFYDEESINVYYSSDDESPPYYRHGSQFEELHNVISRGNVLEALFYSARIGDPQNGDDGDTNGSDSDDLTELISDDENDQNIWQYSVPGAVD